MNKKRLLAWVMMLVMMLTLVPTTVLADSGVKAELTVSEIVGKNLTDKIESGDVIVVSAKMTENSGFCAAGLSVGYDEAKLTLTKIAKGEGMPGTLTTEGAKLLWDHSEDYRGVGAFLEFTFSVNAGVADGDTVVTLQYTTDEDDVSDYNEENVAFSATPCTLTISGGVTPPQHTCTLTKVDAKDATCTEDGNIEYYQCSDPDCGKLYKDAAGTQEITKDDTIIKAGHTDLKPYPAKEPTCDSDGCVAYWFCTGCDNYYFDNNGAVGEKTTVEKVAIPATGHKWVLVVGGYADGATQHTVKCSVCGQKKDEAHADRPGDESKKWESDKDSHWNVYGCGTIMNKAAHTWDAGVETTPATCTTDGVKTYTCKVCSETKTEPIKASGHSLTKVEAVAATCTEGGNNEYYTCNVCKKVFKADKTTETTVADETLAALGHSMTKTEAKAATCTEPGNSEYYTCGNCGKFFSDADGKNEIAKDRWVIKALGHDFTGAWVNTDAAGHYHKCTRCDVTDTVVKHTYSGKPCTDADNCTVCGYVKAPGVHAWGAAEYKWSDDYKSCTATVKCTNCEAVETDVAFIGISTTPATCTVDGKTVYTATFSSNLFTTQTKEVTIDKLGHTYGAPVWSWSEDGKTATATFTCTREGCTAETTGHAQTVTATVSGKQNVAPTCTDKGTTTYTAKVTFETKDYTDTKDVQDIKALGHKMTKTAAKAATCTEPGNNEYWTCSVCKKVFKADKTTETTVAAETLAALGHKMTKTPAKAATCVAEGNNEYYTCSVCNKVFKDEQGNTLTTVAAETLAKDPTNHTGGTELRGAVAASCMTAGRTDDTYCKGCGKLTKAGDLIPPTGVHNYKDGVCTTCGSKQPADNATIKAAIEKVVADVKEAVEEVLDKAIKNETDANTKKILEKLKGYVSGSSRSKLQAVYSVTMSLNGQDLDKGDSLADGQNVTIAISEETYNALKSGAKIVESYLDKDGNAQTREINATLKQVGDGYTVTFASDKTAVYGLMTRTSSGGSSGSGSPYTSGQSFTTDLPADSINRVTVNGKKLDSKYYTVSSNGSGSIVTLTDAYLATLKAGKYTVKIENKTHVSTGTFTIKADGTLSSPKTADAGIALYAMLAVSSLMGTAVVSKKRRKA